MSCKETLRQIKERGYWKVTMHADPDQYDGGKFGFDDLQDFVRTHQVRYRGIPFPDLEERKQSGYRNNETYIESFTQTCGCLKTFRFYRSGQFVHYSRMLEDVEGSAEQTFARSDPRYGKKFLSTLACIYHLTETFLFASRLADKGVFGDRVNIQIELRGVGGRVLHYADPYDFPFNKEYVCRKDVVDLSCTKTPAELKVKRDNLAVEACAKILEYFQFSSEYVRDGLKSDQEDFYQKNFRRARLAPQLAW